MNGTSGGMSEQVGMSAAAGPGRVAMSVDGRVVEVGAGLTILQALHQEGIHLPSLCHDLRLERSNGNCGLCVVEVADPGEGTEDLDPNGVHRVEVKACHTPVQEGMTVTTRSPRLEAYRKIRLEQLLGDHNADCEAPCEQTCPAHIDIQRYLTLVADGNTEAAVRVIKDSNPFPVVCGRVCPHPCEAECRRGLVDDPIAINFVKRFAADWDLNRENPWRPKVPPPTGKTIAIIGAGPSGLSAAYYSALNGHAVTVFERQPHAGGMMRYGIPEYRLPKVTLDAEIELIHSLGVRIVTGRTLGTHLRLEDLQQDFDAVYLAIGSWRPTPMQLEGENHDGVWLGIQYLEAVTKGEDPGLGETVVVIGGGNTAIDCVRTALRKGAREVKLLYRRTAEEMPAEPHEVAAAREEGVDMVFLTAPTAISLDPETGRKQVHCIRMELGEPDRSGRRRPVPVDGSEFVLDADTVIGAIGQATNTQFLYHDLPVRLNKWGDVDIDGTSMQTSAEKIFAGGDCVTGPATVIQAVAAGRHAAAAMDQFVRKGYVRLANASYNCSRGRLEDLPRDEFEAVPRLARAPMPELPIETRVHDFDIVELGFDEATARAEAARCLKCGCKERFVCGLRHEATAMGIDFQAPLHVRPRTPVVRDHPFIVRDHNKCISCGRCVAACAEIEGPGVLAFQFSHGQLTVGTHTGEPLSQTDCVSCGQCVNACPCGALDYVRERGRVFAALNDPSQLVVGFVAPAVRSVISERYGVPFNEAAPFIAGLMRKVGFDRVFDFTFAADLTIMEETTEFLQRVERGGVMPQFTSCCPGWINFVERRYPQLIPHLSTCKSPQQMMGATVRGHYGPMSGADPEHLYVVSIVPCMAKKYEAARPEFAPGGRRDVDAVLTTSEFLEMIDMIRLDVDEVRPAEFDAPYARVSGAGMLFGAPGGVAEAAMRMAVEKLTGHPQQERLTFRDVPGAQGMKETTVVAGDREVRVAVIAGLHHAEPLIRRVIAGEDVGYDLVEVMACPAGCIAGAGHPVPVRISEMKDRQSILVSIDQTSRYRASQENPDILRLYDDFYGEPNSPLAHELLHTTYAPFRS